MAALWPYVGGDYRVRAGHFTAREDAEVAAATYATYAWQGTGGGICTPSADRL